MWDERYAGEDYLFGTDPNAFLASQRHLLTPGAKALVVADGEGRNGVWLAEQGLDVTTFDASGRGVEKSLRFARQRGVVIKSEVADVATWRWPQGEFDVVAAIFVQFADPVLRQVLFQRMKATLAPGGLLILQGYRPEQVDLKTGGPPHREHMYTRALLEDAFGGFDILHLQEHDSEIHEGCGHAGLSALIDLVARKPR